MLQNSQDILQEAERIRRVTIEGIAGLSFNEGFVGAVHHLSTTTGSLFCLGIGKSGIIAKKLAATFASLGFPAFFLHPTEALHGDMGRVQNQDSVIALSHSGTTSELLEALLPMEKRGVTLIAITGNSSSPLARKAHYTLCSHIQSEACIWNIVPTTSLVTAMTIGDALALCAGQQKQVTKEDFARNHPKGALGALLHNMVEHAMQKDNLPIIYNTATLQDGISILHQYNSGAVFILDANSCVEGVLTDGDIRRLLIQGRIQGEEGITAYMNTSPKVGTLRMTTAQLLDIMEANAITVLPIVDDESKLQGILHIHDILGRGKISFQ